MEQDEFLGGLAAADGELALGGPAGTRVVSVARGLLREAEPDSLAQETFNRGESLLLLRVGETELVAEALSCARFRQSPDLPDIS